MRRAPGRLAGSAREIIAIDQAAFQTLFIGRLRFNLEFKLDIPEIVLCLDPLSISRYGHFRYGYNGFGLKGEIAINTRYLTDQRSIWEILGTLLHEMLHAWQQVHGTPAKRNHHNAELRRKAATLGLVIDRRGVTSYAAESPFKELLRHYGLAVPATDIRASAH